MYTSSRVGGGVTGFFRCLAKLCLLSIFSVSLDVLYLSMPGCVSVGEKNIFVDMAEISCSKPWRLRTV